MMDYCLLCYRFQSKNSYFVTLHQAFTIRMKKHLNIKVSGKVQGVWYRATTKRVADEMGIKGFVRNEPDGSVYIEAEADAENLFRFTLWCHQGPEGARVEKVETNEGELKSFSDFRIER